MEKVRRQHYVPRMYLKRFGYGNIDDEYISVLKLDNGTVLDNRKVENFAVANYFYDADKEQIAEILKEDLKVFPELCDNEKLSDEQFTEHALAREESAISKMLNELQEDLSRIHISSNRNLMVIFLHSLAYRTKQFRDQMDAINNKTEKWLNSMCDNLGLDEETKKKIIETNCSTGKNTQLYQILGIKPVLETMQMLFVFEAAIDLLSFIQLFPKDWKKRSYLSLGGVSSRALMAFLSERPQITSVFLCLDNDQAGNEACEKLAGEISERYSVIRLKPSRKDWNEILCDKNADRKKAIAETITIKVPEAEELVPMLCYEDIEQTSVDWLWFPYIPFGKLTIIQGNPGEGKTYFAMMLTAACTNRKLFPNMEDIEPFNVIYQTAEDGMGDTIKPRLVEAGADLSRVMVIDDTEEALTLSDDRIEKAVRQNQVRLVIIDPVQAFIGADVDMNRANEVRPVFRKLGMIAEKTGCAIVLIGHLNKSSGTQSTYRGLGSIDIMAAVRSLIFIGKVRKDPTTRVLIHEKSSLAPPGETMAFKLGDEEGFRWVGAYEISADELLDGKEGKATETKLERGRKLIMELLADKKEISIRELDEKAKEQGISGRTMRDVRSRMKNELEYRVIPNVWHKHIVPLWNGAKDVLFSKELKIDQIKCETEYKVVENQSIFSETMTKEEVDAEKRKLLYHWIGLLSSLTKLRNAGELDVESTLAQLTEPMMIERVNALLGENPNLLETDKYILLHSLLGRDLYMEGQLIPIRAAEIKKVAKNNGGF